MVVLRKRIQTVCTKRKINSQVGKKNSLQTRALDTQNVTTSYTFLPVDKESQKREREGNVDVKNYRAAKKPEGPRRQE